MKNAIITAVSAVTGFALGGLIGCLHSFRTYPRRYVHLTGGSFRETYEDNEPHNPNGAELDDEDEAQDFFIHFDWAAES